MNHSEFTLQMNRLCQTFGKAAYADERLRLIWNEVGSYSEAWFRKVCDEFIGNMRQAPLISDFAARASEERERLWREEKRRNEADARDFWKQSKYTDEEVQTILGMIKRRCLGQVPDNDWNAFMRMIESMR